MYDPKNNRRRTSIMLVFFAFINFLMLVVMFTPFVQVPGKQGALPPCLPFYSYSRFPCYAHTLRVVRSTPTHVSLVMLIPFV